MINQGKKNPYHLQVELLFKVLPYVAKESCFALKGGTAINFFVRDMPRLSVDIDLTYLPIESRDDALMHIEEALMRIKNTITEYHGDITVEEKRTRNESRLSKLFIKWQNTLIKIEPNEVLRGSVYPCEPRDLSSKAEQIFQLSISDMPTLSVADLYGGKICAALARQHPRDLFDVKLLFENEGITNSIRQAFVIYLASSPRPIHELLNPNPKIQDVQKTFEDEFLGMTQFPVNYTELVETRYQLINQLLQSFTDAERKFLLSVKMGEPDWSAMPIGGIRSLPALEWKIINIKKMDKVKHAVALENLKKVLEC